MNKPDLKVPPPRPSAARLQQLQQLADLHHDWVERHVADSGFTPRGVDSDYPLHHLDVDGANPEAEDEFQSRAREIMGLATVGRSDMVRLAMVDASSGATVGVIGAADELVFFDHTTLDVFRSVQSANGWGDDRTFDALAAGLVVGGYAFELDEAILDEIARAEGPDEDDEILRAGDRERLHHYWTRGKGLAKWLGKPHQWTTLYRHLRKYVGSSRAKRMAAQWVHEVTGMWTGSDAYRVAHGKRPRGERVGPG